MADKRPENKPQNARSRNPCSTTPPWKSSEKLTTANFNSGHPIKPEEEEGEKNKNNSNKKNKRMKMKRMKMKKKERMKIMTRQSRTKTKGRVDGWVEFEASLFPSWGDPADKSMHLFL